MASPEVDTPNAAMEEFWNGPAGERWASEQLEFDRLIVGFGEAALDSAAARVGERCIDLGCGTGTTSLALADAVGPSGDYADPVAGK